MANEFYENADECFGWASTAKTERERLIFMQMRDAWLEAARKCEAKEVRSNPRDHLQSHGSNTPQASAWSSAFASFRSSVSNLRRPSG
jgi:hypothetical protein